MPEAAKSTVAVLPALSGNPVRLIVKVADASASSLIEAGDAPIEKLTASSISVMSTLADGTVIDAEPSTMVGLLSVDTIDSMPSMASSFSAVTVKARVEPTKLESKVSVVPSKLTPAVASATACSAATRAGV